MNRITFLAFLPYDCQDIDWEELPSTDQLRSAQLTPAAPHASGRSTIEQNVTLSTQIIRKGIQC